MAGETVAVQCLVRKLCFNIKGMAVHHLLTVTVTLLTEGYLTADHLLYVLS